MSVRVAKILAKPWPKCYGKTKPNSGRKQATAEKSGNEG